MLITFYDGSFDGGKSTMASMGTKGPIEPSCPQGEDVCHGLIMSQQPCEMQRKLFNGGSLTFFFSASPTSACE
jgi:hypothetical protein